MDIAEYIYEGVVKPSYKKPNIEYANRSGHSRNKRRESSLSQTHPDMVKRAGKCIKRHVYCPSGESKICLIHSPRHSYDECNILGDSVDNYS